jgi:hypothetical protein
MAVVAVVGCGSE